MAFKDELRRLRKQDGMTQAELAVRLGIAKSTISMYECGNREPDFETLESIADFFNVDMNRLTGIDKAAALSYSPASNASLLGSAVPLTAQEQNLLSAYRKASAADKQIIDNIVLRYVSEKGASAPLSKIIPLFGTSAAAGPGEPDTGLPWENYEVPVGSRAEFAVRITGDSMEPVLHDGQIALCMKSAPQIGDVAVIMVNGALVVKQFITDGRNIYLRSLNRARKDLDIDIWESGDDTVLCFGTVILKRRPALVVE